MPGQDTQLLLCQPGARAPHLLDLADTSANIKKAARMLHAIKAEIKAGVYDRRAHVGDAKGDSGGELFCDLSADWLKLIEAEDRKKSTMVKYRQIVDALRLPTLGRFHVNELTVPIMRKSAAEAADWSQLSPVRWNDALIVLRGIISLGVERGLCHGALVAWAKNKKRAESNLRPG